MPRHERLLVLLVPLLLVATGCPRAPLDFGRDGEAQSAEEVLKRVELAESTVVGVRGDGRLSVDSPQGRGSVSLFLAVFHPALIHIEQLDFFGKPQGVFTTDGKEFGLYDSQANLFFHGPPTGPNLGRFLPLVMPPNELAALILGRPPRIQHEEASFALDADKRVYVVTLQKGQVTQRLEIDLVTSRILKSHVEGIAAYDTTYSELTAYGGVWFPKRVSIDAPDIHTHVELVAKDIEVNEAPDLTLFEATAPEGVKVVEVDEAGNEKV